MINQRRSFSAALLQFTSMLSLGVGLALALLLALTLGAGVIFSGRIFPGVTMSGIPLSGLSIKEASYSLSSTYKYPETGQILLTYGANTWMVHPNQLGFFLDPDSSARAAFNTGRRGGLFQIILDRFGLLRNGVDVQPTFIYNQNSSLDYLLTLAQQINQPLREASLSISGTDVIVNNGQPGRALDVQASLAAITRQVESMQDGVVPLAVIETNPVILDATYQAELARGILSQPMKLALPAELAGQSGSWKLEPATLAKMLTFERVTNGASAELQVVVNKPLMTAYLESIKDETNVAPENARFIFNDETRLLDLKTPAVIGRELNIERSIENINASLKNGEHSAFLAFELTNPPVTDKMSGADLGITELVSSYTSYFRGSSADRVQNIKTASSRFHGLMIAPGATLSMSDVLGNISLDNGYAEALIILGDETIKGVGGGVCQVSTTLFRTVFFGGYPIVERHAHAYRVGYYEQTYNGHDQNLAGLDATVFVPLVDFKFTNDTPHWLLMETYVSTSNYSLTWKFYSTKDGRSVDWTTSGLKNVVESGDPIYRENPELSSGTIKQVDWAVDGADVTVNRTVTRDGKTLYQDRFVTHYQAWRDIFEYGPGTELPKNR